MHHTLSKQQRKEIKDIRKSRLFDAKWYRDKYADVAKSGIRPEVHYALYGWKEGKDPSPKFITNTYLTQNKDVAAAGINPLVHYERNGRAEGRICAEVYTSYGAIYKSLRWLQKNANKDLARKNAHARILVHIHMFYPTAWVEMKEYMENLAPYNYDLYVTYADVPGMQHTIDEMKVWKPGLTARQIENKGFDVGPFIDVVSEIDLTKYDIVYHAHSKSISPRKVGRLAYGRIFKGSSWFRQLYSGICGIRNVHKGIDYLMNAKDCGMIAAGNVLFEDMPSRYKLVKEFARRMGIHVPTNYRFVGGTCFGTRSKHLQWIKDNKLTLSSFKESARGIFTLAHAVERLFTIVVQNNGEKVYPMPTFYNNHLREVVKREKSKSKHQLSQAKFIEELGIKEAESLDTDMPSGLAFSFWTGQYQGKPAFIKIGNKERISKLLNGDSGIGDPISYEFEMQKLAHQLMPEYVPAVYMFDENHAIICTELLQGYNLSSMMQFGMSQEEKERVISALNDIRTKLADARILHRDIRPENIMVCKDKVYLIDFQFAVRLNPDNSFEEMELVKASPSIRASLGNKYRAHEDGWDDSISIDKVIQDILAS